VSGVTPDISEEIDEQLEFRMQQYEHLAARQEGTLIKYKREAAAMEQRLNVALNSLQGAAQATVPPPIMPGNAGVGSGAGTVLARPPLSGSGADARRLQAEIQELKGALLLQNRNMQATEAIVRELQQQLSRANEKKVERKGGWWHSAAK